MRESDSFRKLECERRVIVAEGDRYFSWFAVWDIEGILMECPESTKRTQWVRKQRVCCISMVSNIPAFTDAKCYNGNNPAVSIEKSVEYFQLMRNGVLRLA